MLKINIFILFLCAFMPMTATADLTATVDNSQIPYGETLMLRLSYDGMDGNISQPDFSALRKDFNIYSTSSSMNTSFINGAASQMREWILTLQPKNEGKITIPTIKVGQYSSQPIEIEVLSSDKVIQRENSDITADTDVNTAQTAVFAADLSVDNDNPYVEQGIAAVLTIRDNRDFQLSNEPYFENADDWIIKRLDKPETITQNGKNITKINYVMYPQKSNIKELPRAVIEGYYVVYESSPQRSFGSSLLQMLDMGSMFGVQKPVLFKSKPKPINVKPIPAEFNGKSWTPAEILVATSEWLDKNPKFKVGETVAREIAVTVAGIDESQLPEISFDENPDWKQYPDKPQYVSSVHENKLISQETVRVVYIPQKSGKLKLPEIKIPWFNIKTQKKEIAVIDSEEIEVLPNEAYEAIVTEIPDEKIEQQEQETQSPIKREDGLKIRSETKYDNMYIVFIAAMAAFLCGLIISFLLFGHKKENNKEKTPNDNLKNIKKSLSGKDYRGVRDALVYWGETVFSDKRINNLNDLATAIGDGDFTAQCEIINAILYGNTNEIPDDKVILNTLKKTAVNKADVSEKPLPNLYK